MRHFGLDHLGTIRAITSVRGTDGIERVALDGSVKSKDVDFTNLRIAVNCPGIIEILQTAPSDRFSFKDTGMSKSATLDALQLSGITLPSAGPAEGYAIVSPKRGVAQIHLSSAFSSYQQAPVVAAELAGHTVPGLLGKGADSSPNEHRNRETPAKTAGRTNRDAVMLPTP